MRQTYKLVPWIFSLAFGSAYATDGYFAHGYGIKALGLGGAGIAYAQDAIAAATNPAGLGVVGDRIDFGLTWFQPDRDVTLRNTAGGSGFFDGKYSGNDTDNFLIPEFGYNRVINDRATLGVTVYGNGGMNTDYKNGIPYFNNNTNQRTGINYLQLIVAPTATWRLDERNVVGVSLNLAYQRFQARGLDSFDQPGFTTATGKVSNNGNDHSYGAGLRLGWVGQVSDAVSLGATYQTRTYMSKFDKYAGLFAEGGDIDIPANYGIGIAVKATPALTVLADAERILYSQVDAIGNASVSNLLAGNRLGASNGAGFGWRDVTVLKLGAQYAYSDSLTLRAGYNHSSQPVRSQDAFINILAPGVVQDHVTLGATYTLADKSELSFFYAHAFSDKVRGDGAIPALFGGGDVDLRMNQNSLGIAYGWKL